jgi:hypothetical protein
LNVLGFFVIAMKLTFQSFLNVLGFFVTTPAALRADRSYLNADRSPGARDPADRSQ